MQPNSTSPSEGCGPPVGLREEVPLTTTWGGHSENYGL